MSTRPPAMTNTSQNFSGLTPWRLISCSHDLLILKLWSQGGFPQQFCLRLRPCPWYCSTISWQPILLCIQVCVYVCVLEKPHPVLGNPTQKNVFSAHSLIVHYMPFLITIGSRLCASCCFPLSIHTVQVLEEGNFGGQLPSHLIQPSAHSSISSWNMPCKSAKLFTETLNKEPNEASLYSQKFRVSGPRGKWAMILWPF